MFPTIQTQSPMLTRSGLASWPTGVARLLASTGLRAGLAGGLAEAVWIGLYARAQGMNGFDIARRVADAVFPGVLHMQGAPALGLAIHFGLSAILGVVLVRLLASSIVQRPGSLFPICLGALALIWGLNFGVILPVINPIFPMLLPMWVTLLSKLLFGAAVAGVISQKSAGAE